MNQIFALAFDHRNSFRRGFMNLSGDPAPEQHAAMVAAKEVVVDALLAAVPQVPAGSVVLLMDHEYGGGFVSRAQAGGIRVAMPVEESGQRELRYLCDGHPDLIVESYQPDFAKVLIRYNPGGDTEMNVRQRTRLRELAGWLAGRPQRLMLELLVPPEQAQLAAVDYDRGRFDRELRAELTATAVTEIAGAGILPWLWKVEGPESRDDAARVAKAVLDADPDSGCLVLGRGADFAAVRRWLANAAVTDGFRGFAVGRTIWWDALRGFVDGGDRVVTRHAITARYLDLVREYIALA
jgi:myo-inositol catabolism protein IolC